MLSIQHYFKSMQHVYYLTDNSHLPFEKCAIRLQAQKLPIIQTQSFKSWHIQGWTLSHMARWSTSVFAWEMQAKDSCSREDLCPCYMLSADRAMLQLIWWTKRSWQSHHPAFCNLLRLWRTRSILQSLQASPVHSVYPGGDSYSVRLLDKETRSAPDPPSLHQLQRLHM